MSYETRTEWQYEEYVNWMNDGSKINTNVVELQLNCNETYDLSILIYNLINLEKLYCSNIRSLPNTLNKLKKLRILYCTHSVSLTVLPESIGNIINLQELFCYNCRIKYLPESICNLTNLKSLDCEKNELTYLPESIGNLTNLMRLNCEYNKIHFLPDSICNLTKLQFLNCSINCLRTLPKSIGNLQNLVYLDCQMNIISTLPISMVKLKKLQIFQFYGDIYLPTELRIFLHNLKNKLAIDVHTESINNSLIDSINNLTIDNLTMNDLIDNIIINIEWTTQYIIKDDILNEYIKKSLLKYLDDKTICKNLLLDFNELLSHIIIKIEN